MKLELKHLAPYLPYKLKIGEIKNFEKEREMICGGFNSSETVDIEPCVRLQYKPILRPLSDLTKKKGVAPYGKQTEELIYLMEVNPSWNSWDFDKKPLLYTLPYKSIEYLISKHFDVFGLIPNGLAIDINTIEP